MRKVILTMHMSLDGFIAGPNGELDWTAADEAVDNDLPELLSTADTALVGRVLYQGFAGYWPIYNITGPIEIEGRNCVRQLDQRSAQVGLFDDA